MTECCPTCGFRLLIGEAADYGMCRPCWDRQGPDDPLMAHRRLQETLLHARVGENQVYDPSEEMGEAGWVGGA